MIKQMKITTELEFDSTILELKSADKSDDKKLYLVKTMDDNY